MVVTMKQINIPIEVVYSEKNENETLWWIWNSVYDCWLNQYGWSLALNTTPAAVIKHAKSTTSFSDLYERTNTGCAERFKRYNELEPHRRDFLYPHK